jgi:iron(III) transport system ATP-binding protein
VVTARDGATATVRVGSMTLDVHAPGTLAGDVVVAVRPQAIRVEPAATPATLAVTVRKATYLGSHMEYALDSAVGELFAVDAEVSRAVAAGSVAHVRFDPGGIALVGR